MSRPVDTMMGETPIIVQTDFNGELLPDGAVARLGPARSDPPDDLLAMALSPDGKTVAMARHDGGTCISFLDIPTGKLTHKFNLRTMVGDEMVFSDDGKC